MMNETDLIKQLRAIVDDDDNSGQKRLLALKSLLKYDTVWAEDRLAEFVENNVVWAIEEKIKRIRKNQSLAGGLGVLDEDDTEE